MPRAGGQRARSRVAVAGLVGLWIAAAPGGISACEYVAGRYSTTSAYRVPQDGTGTLHVDARGRISQIRWRHDPQAQPYENQLVYRERSIGGIWTETEVGPPWDATWATLVVDSSNQPHVLLYDSELGVSHWVRDGSSFVLKDALGSASSSRPPFPSLGHVAAAIGPDDVIHVVMSDEGRGLIVYANDRGGLWQSETAAPADTAESSYFSFDEPRFLSIAVDASGCPHITYGADFSAFVRDSKLHYANRCSGAWDDQVIQEPADGSGDGGLGASIAVAPGGAIQVAAFYVEAFASGSAQWSALRLLTRAEDGSWSSSEITRKPDKYAAGDGSIGTGFAPTLLYDDAGRTHIFFSDHASQHFPSAGSDEFAGQFRHAFFDGTWHVATLRAQSMPVQNQLIRSAVVLYGDGIGAYAFLVRHDELAPNLSIESTTCTYEEYLPEPDASALALAAASAVALRRARRPRRCGVRV